MMPTCPACRRSLALGDRNGRHVASEAHYPHLDEAGTMTCSPPIHAGRGDLTRDVMGETRSPGRPPLRLVTVLGRKVAPN